MKHLWMIVLFIAYIGEAIEYYRIGLNNLGFAMVLFALAMIFLFL